MDYPVRNWSLWYNAQAFGAVVPEYGYHEGDDLNLKTGGDTDLGQPLLAIADGVVTSVHSHTTSPTFGKHIHIRHDGPWGTVWCHYAHCNSILVTEGQSVKQGQQVATVGKTGTQYSHLHWAIKLVPTGIDAIARTATDLKKWTNPTAFVQKWRSVPTTPGPMPETSPLKYTEEQMSEVRLERDKNWNLYQATLTELNATKTELKDVRNKYQSFLEYLAERLNYGTLTDESVLKGSLEELFRVEELKRQADRKIEQMEKAHELEVSELREEIKLLRAAVEQQQAENRTLLTRIEELEKKTSDTEESKEAVNILRQFSDYIGRIFKR